MAVNPYMKYKENSINIASQEQLVIMLVDGAIKYTKVAKLALERGDKKRAHDELIRVQSIFAELIASLDVNAGNFAIDLMNIYNFIRNKLIEANIKKDINIINEVIPVIEDVRNMWHEVKKNYDLQNS